MSDFSFLKGSFKCFLHYETPLKSQVNNCKQMLYALCTVYMVISCCGINTEREEDSHLHVHQQPGYLQLESRTTSWWPSTITAGAIRLEQPIPLEQDIWHWQIGPRLTSHNSLSPPCPFTQSACGSKNWTLDLDQEKGAQDLAHICLLNTKAWEKSEKLTIRAQLLTKRHSVEMWAGLHCWCCMRPRLGFSALQG